MAGSRKLEVEIVGDSRSLERAFGRASKDTGAFGRGLGNLAKAGLIAGAALGGAFAIGAKKSLDAAADLTEQMNKASVVFRGNEKQVIEWSQGLAQGFGLSSRAALEAAGTFGNMLVPMGLARDEAAKMSERLTELGGDMASFNNASIEDTLLAIRAGLAGETEPLRRYGVFLSAARVEQEALAATGKKSAKQLTEQEKVTARYNLILKDTADTQGDFARSAGTSVANQLRIMQAEFENLAASLGQVLLPIALKFLTFVNTKLIPGIGRAADVVKDWWSEISRRFSKAPNVRAKLNVTIEGVQNLAVKFVDAFIGQLESLLPQKPVRILEHGIGIEVAGGTDWDAVASNIIAGIAAALEKSAELAKALSQTISKALDGIDWVGLGKKAGPGLAAMLVSAFASLLDPAFWAKNWELALAIALVVFRGKIVIFAGKAGAFIGKELGAMLSRISPTFAAAFGRLIDDAGKIGIAVFNRVSAKLYSLVSSAFGRLTKAAVFILKVLGVNAAITAVVDFARRVNSELLKVDRWFSQLPGKIKGYFAEADSWLYDAGVAIIQGLWDGLKSKWEDVKSWFSGLKDKIPKIKGPPSEDARLLTENGRLIMQGLQRGLDSGWQPIQNWLGTLGDKMAEKIGSAIDKAAQAVSSKRSAFESAFSELTSVALEAFDKVNDTLTKSEKALQRLTKSEKQLSQMESKREAERIEKAVRDAQTALDEAIGTGLTMTMKEGESPEDFAERQRRAGEEIKAAQQALDDALYEQKRAALQKQAEQERAALEKRAAQERKHRDEQLALKKKHLEDDLQAAASAYERGKISLRQYNERILKIMKEYGIPFKKAAGELGGFLAEGLREAMAEASKAAKALAQAVIDQLSNIKVVVQVDIRGSGESDKKNRQHGGPVLAGQSYIVGEAGPELFVPKHSGTIIPNGGGNARAIGGAPAVTVNVYGSVTSERDLVETIRNALIQEGRRKGGNLLAGYA